jgi:hypothetical protein
MARGSAVAHSQRNSKKGPELRTIRAGTSLNRGARLKSRKKTSARVRVRVVRSRATGARKPSRPLPAPDPLSERLFLGSLERSLRENRTVWEALAKR